MANWRQDVFKLPRRHRWKAKPGHKIFVADRGAVRFEYPAEWVVIPGADSIKFHDREPPHDDCLLQFSLMRLPPGVDWTDLPLTRLVEEIVSKDPREIIVQNDIVTIERPDLELAWIEVRFVDPNERREACSRSCLGRGSDLQPFLTMDFWLEDLGRFGPVWDDVLQSIQLGLYIPDIAGPNVH